MTLLIEGLFALLFVRALWAYVVRRDDLARDVALVFSAMMGLFVLDVLVRTVDDLPAWVASLGSILVLAQPPLTLRLVRRIRPVPAPVYWTAWGAWLVTAVLVVAGGNELPLPAVAGALVLFLGAEAFAAVLLGRSARQRAGSSRARLILAAAATWLFAAAAVGAAVTASVARGEGPLAAAANQTALALALLSGLGYLVAFHPPRWLREVWSSQAGNALMRQLLRAPSDEAPDALRRWYVDIACRVTGAGAAMLWVGPSVAELSLMASSGLPPAEAKPPLPAPGPAGLGNAGREALLLVDRPVSRCPPWLVASAQRAGANYVTAVPIDVPRGAAALVLLNRFRSLFTADDATLLAQFGTQVRALVERQTLLAERGELTERLSDSLTAMSAAAQAKSDFLANMSHELRTPLNAIIGFSDLMSTEQPAGDRIAVPSEWVGHINSSGRHLLGLINDVLDLAKVEAGRVELRREVLDLRGVLEDSVNALRSLSDDKHQEVTVAVAPVRVRADPLRFRQILTNLLSNAIKFTPAEGRIYVAARRVGHEVALSVADTGPGIAPEDQQRVFEEFQQAGTARVNKGGTGLGLALTLRLVQAHGGRLELESEPGHGSKFTVYLPAADQAVAPEASAGSPRPVPTGLIGPSADGEPAAARPGVLVIEDDPATARLLAAYLEGAGYRATVAPDGEAGLEQARRGHFEAVLLDVLLPGIDGWEVLRRLKRDDGLREIPVLIISVVEEQQIGLALGASDYFVKPVDRQTIISWLARSGLIPPMGGPDVTVLAIDDDPVALRLVEEHLRQPGIAVLTATDGVAGLRIARERSPDLIVCDLLMPGLDGFDVIAALHDDPHTRDIPVVVLSAHDLSEAEKERLSGKVRTVVAKVPDAARLDQVVTEVSKVIGMAEPAR